jgi:hypothetical protein
LFLFEFKEEDAGKPLKATCFQPLLTNSKLTKDVLLLFDVTKIELVMVCASLMTHRPVQKCPTVARNQQEEPKLLISLVQAFFYDLQIVDLISCPRLVLVSIRTWWFCLILLQT